jgi:hypothetical protein
MRDAPLNYFGDAREFRFYGIARKKLKFLESSIRCFKEWKLNNLIIGLGVSPLGPKAGKMPALLY